MGHNTSFLSAQEMHGLLAIRRTDITADEDVLGQQGR